MELSVKDLDYERLKELFESCLAEFTQMSVATSFKDLVTVRTVYVICRGFNIYFLTRRSSNKYKQLSKNINIALCSENIQLEGKTCILGHPRDSQNKEVVDYCLGKGYEWFEHYIWYKNTVLVEVHPHLICRWLRKGREYLDLDKKKAYCIG